MVCFDVAAAMMGEFSSTHMCAHLVYRCFFWIIMSGLVSFVVIPWCMVLLHVVGKFRIGPVALDTSN
jgi:hypothetical protein